MVAHAQSELPAECCGLLTGRLPSAVEHQAVVKVEKLQHPLRNGTWQSPTEYLSEPRSMFDAMRGGRNEKWM